MQQTWLRRKDFAMREKADSELVRRQNRRLVLDALRQTGPLARVELGRVTGLSPATITSIANQLTSDSLIVERHDLGSETNAPRRGRPLTRIDLDPAATLVLALNVSIAGIEMALADYRGAVVARQSSAVATYAARPDAFTARVIVEIQTFLARVRVALHRVSRIGIAIQGAADQQHGAIMWSPAFKTRNIALVEPVEQALGIPCSISNDANMMAEALNREARGGTTAVVFMGYGVGMGLIIDGKVYHGPTGAAGEFGHMNHLPGGAVCRCGRKGCIEAYVADYAILRSANGAPDDPANRSGVAPETMKALEERARAGEPSAAKAYASAGEALGYGLARLTSVLSPTLIVLSGPGTAAIDLIEPHLRAAFAAAVVEELRRNTVIETRPIGDDMIVAGTIASTLRGLDSTVFAAGPLPTAQGWERIA